MQLEQYCLVQEHQNQAITHLCVYKECMNDFRWACNVCIEKKIHQHGQNNKRHLTNKEQLIQLLSQQQTHLETLISQIQQNIFTITRQQMNRIIKIHSESAYLQNYLMNEQEQQQVQQKVELLEQQQDVSRKRNFHKKQYDLKYAVYFEYAIKKRHLKFYYMSCISPDEKTLVFFINRTCYIYDLITKQEICKRLIKHNPCQSFFSSDSKYFFMVNLNEKVVCYRVNQNLKILYQVFIRQVNFYTEIIFINPSIYLMMNTDKIIMNNIKRNKLQILHLKGLKCKIKAIEYCQQQNTLIFVQSHLVNEISNQNIKFTKMPNKQLIFQQKFIQTNLIRLIKNNQLISSYCGSKTSDKLYLWEINYTQKELTILRSFLSKSIITSFNYMMELNRIYVQGYCSIQILNLDFEIVQKIKPKKSKFFSHLSSETYCYENYIIFIGKSKI